MTLSPERRRALLDEYFALYRRLEELGHEPTLGSARSKKRAAAFADFSREIDLRQEYVEGLPVRALSRCPFTGELLRISIDDAGLDGLWWRFEGASRPKDDVPATFFALAGAVHLRGEVVAAPFLAKPGPEVPYIIPRLLALPSVRAVLSSVAIGQHEGYAIAYFADPIPTTAPRCNTWGANEYRDADDDGDGWHSVMEDPDDYDFELAPWLADGRLLWIGPGDEWLVRREGAEDCPYLGLPGRRSVLRIQDGRVWTPEDVA
jgi:hypothetical protein